MFGWWLDVVGAGIFAWDDVFADCFGLVSF